MKKLFIFLVMLSLLSCDTTTSTSQEQDDRLIGVDILNSTETGSYEENIALGKAIGMDYVDVHFDWFEFLVPVNTPLEIPNSSINNNFVDHYDRLKTLILQGYLYNSVYNIPLKYTLTLRTIDLGRKPVPNELLNSSFNSTEMKDNFQKLLKYILQDCYAEYNGVKYYLKDYLIAIQIGNEIDEFDATGTQPSPDNFWSDYTYFLYEMKTYIQNTAFLNLPNIKVGFTATANGTLYGDYGSRQSIIYNLANYSAIDIIGMTYYPQDENFQVKDPATSPHTDLYHLANLFRNLNKPIYLQEVGYQSSPNCGSSNQMQSTFFLNFFEAWDNNSDIIKAASFNRLNDVSHADAIEIIGSHATNPGIEMISFIKTLGLRTYTGKGENKPAYNTIKNEVNKRGL
jgi:hypothetical protein